MKSLPDLTTLPRWLLRRAAAISIAVALIVGHPGVRAQTGQAAEHWVGTCLLYTSPSPRDS